MTTSQEAEELDCTVVIAGAGPTGLTLANELHRHGVQKILCIEKLMKRVPWSKAFGIHARTSEVFRTMGVLNQILAAASPLSHISWRWPNGKHVDLAFPATDLVTTRIQGVQMLSQAETESILEAHLIKQGGQVERGWELISIEPLSGEKSVQDDHEGDNDSKKYRGPFSCILRSDDKRERRITCQYVVGCDGAHSNTRKLLNIPFRGSPYPETFLLADLETDKHGNTGSLGNGVTFWLGHDRPIMTFALKSNLFRLITLRTEQEEQKHQGGKKREDAATRGAGEGDVTFEEVEAIMESCVPGVQLRQPPVWISAFHLQRRCVDRYNKGNVLLAGDAAHIHSPAGGQGLNLGIQDAYNLAWKLALVHLKGANPALLDSYGKERHPTALRILERTDSLNKTFLSNGPLGRYRQPKCALCRSSLSSTYLSYQYRHPIALRILERTDTLNKTFLSNGPLVRFFRSRIMPYIIQLFVKSKKARRMFIMTMSQLLLNYRHSPIVKELNWSPLRWFHSGPHAGNRLPDYPLLLVSPSTTSSSISSSPTSLSTSSSHVNTVWLQDLANQGLHHTLLLFSSTPTYPLRKGSSNTSLQPGQQAAAESRREQEEESERQGGKVKEVYHKEVHRFLDTLGPKYQNLVSPVVVLQQGASLSSTPYFFSSIQAGEREERGEGGKEGQRQNGDIQIVIDEHGDVAKAFGAKRSLFLNRDGSALYLIRPDGYVALKQVGGKWDENGVKMYFDSIFG